MTQYVILCHFYYEYHYSPYKLTFQNIMRAGDQKVLINLERPYISFHYFALSIGEGMTNQTVQRAPAMN